MSFETLEFYIGYQYKTLLFIILIYCCLMRLSIRYCKHSICSCVS